METKTENKKESFVDDGELYNKILNRKKEKGKQIELNTDQPKKENDQEPPNTEQPPPSEDGESQATTDSKTSTTEQNETEEQKPPNTSFAMTILQVFDETRAMAFSQYAYADQEHTDEFLTYKDIKSEEHALLVENLARATENWMVSKSPWFIVMLFLVFSSFSIGRKAHSIRAKRMKEEQARAKQQQQPQFAKTPNPSKPGKVVNIKNQPVTTAI